MNKTRMTLYDVAPTILGAFDSHLSEYAFKKFNRKGIQIKTRKKTAPSLRKTYTFVERIVEKVESNHLVIQDEGKGKLNDTFSRLCLTRILNSSLWFVGMVNRLNAESFSRIFHNCS